MNARVCRKHEHVKEIFLKMHNELNIAPGQLSARMSEIRRVAPIHERSAVQAAINCGCLSNWGDFSSFQTVRKPIGRKVEDDAVTKCEAYLWFRMIYEDKQLGRLVVVEHNTPFYLKKKLILWFPDASPEQFSLYHHDDTANKKELLSDEMSLKDLGFGHAINSEASVTLVVRLNEESHHIRAQAGPSKKAKVNEKDENDKKKVPIEKPGPNKKQGSNANVESRKKSEPNEKPGPEEKPAPNETAEPSKKEGANEKVAPIENEGPSKKTGSNKRQSSKKNGKK